jgi:hypothetical protein
MECREELARLRKAIALSHVILASGITVENLEDGAATEEFWGIASKGAQFKSDYIPSRETREVTMRLLADFRETQKRLEALSGNR